MSASVVQVKIKTPNSQITVKLSVVQVSANLLFDHSLLSFYELPLSVLERIGPLRDLVQLTPVPTDQVVQARLVLERWFNTELGYADYKLRHIIPRSTSVACPDKKNKNNARQSFAIQGPVERFHTDSTHTAFTNVWLPIQVTDYFLGFLYDKSSQSLLTADTLDSICRQSTEAQRSFFEKSCFILYNSNLKYGHAIVFRSGGKRGVLHGSFSLNKPNGHRESVEFRCQKVDSSGGWVYGEVEESTS